MNAMMPVLVEVPVNHEVRPMPESVRQRLEVQQKSAEEIALETQRKTARSEMLREAQLESITARAARETQRGEEAAARKRRNAAEEIRKLEAKMLEMTSKSEKRKQEQLEECEKRKQQKQAKAEAVVVSRAQTQMSQIKKGIEKATRACEAVAKRDKKVQEVVKKSSEHVKHAFEVSAQMKEKKDTARSYEALDSPHPGMLDSPHPAVRDSELGGAGLASPHPMARICEGLASPHPSGPTTPRLNIPDSGFGMHKFGTPLVPHFDQSTVGKQANGNSTTSGGTTGKSPRRSESPRRECSLPPQLPSLLLDSSAYHTIPHRRHVRAGVRRRSQHDDYQRGQGAAFGPPLAGV